MNTRVEYHFDTYLENNEVNFFFYFFKFFSQCYTVSFFDITEQIVVQKFFLTNI